MLPMIVFGLIAGYVTSYFTAHLFPQIAVSFIGGIVGIGVAFGIGESSGRKEKTSEISLVSLRAGDYTDGALFLGCGTINSRPHYIYFAALADGGYQLRQMRADEDNIAVHEEDRTGGTLEAYRSCPPPWIRGWLGLWEGSYSYKFRIPKGSIRREFAL